MAAGLVLQQRRPRAAGGFPVCGGIRILIAPAAATSRMFGCWSRTFTSAGLKPTRPGPSIPMPLLPLSADIEIHEFNW